MKKIKKTLVCSLLATLIFLLSGCGSSELNKAFEQSGYKKITVYRHYDTSVKDFDEFEKNHGYMSIESEDGGATVVFKGLYEFRRVHIDTVNLDTAFRTETVEDFCKIIGFQKYGEYAKDKSHHIKSNTLVDYGGYSAIFVEDADKKGGYIYLCKKFEYTYTNEAFATECYKKIVKAVCQEENAEFDYEKLKKEDGTVEHTELNYCTVLCYDREVVSEAGETSVDRSGVLLDSDTYSYTVYYNMTNLLYDAAISVKDVDEQINKEESSGGFGF